MAAAAADFLEQQRRGRVAPRRQQMVVDATRVERDFHAKEVTACIPLHVHMRVLRSEFTSSDGTACLGSYAASHFAAAWRLERHFSARSALKLELELSSEPSEQQKRCRSKLRCMPNGNALELIQDREVLRVIEHLRERLPDVERPCPVEVA